MQPPSSQQQASQYLSSDCRLIPRREVKAGEINGAFKCTECGGYLRDPVVAPCCQRGGLCRDCRCRSLVDNCCPFCGTYVKPTQPHIYWEDKSLKGIMETLFPQALAEEAKREMDYYASHQKPASSTPDPSGSVLPSPNQPADSNSSHSRRPVTSSDQDDHQRNQGGGGGSSSETLSRRNEGGDASFKHEDMWLECYPYESIHISRDQILPPLDMPIIKTQRRIKVCDLKRYLVSVLGLSGSGGDDDQDSLEVLCRGVPMGNDHLLHFIENSHYWRGAEGREVEPRLVLTYRLKGAQVNPSPRENRDN